MTSKFQDELKLAIDAVYSAREHGSAMCEKCEKAEEALENLISRAVPIEALNEAADYGNHSRDLFDIAQSRKQGKPKSPEYWIEQAEKEEQ